MSVIFQLFCAEDLQQLTYAQLQELKTAVVNALEGGTPSQTLAQDSTSYHPRVPQPLTLQISLNTTPSEDTPPQVKEALNNRFHEVSHQLTSLRLKLPQQNFDFEALRSQRNNTASTEEDLILQWAISCEVNNFEFYKRLLDASKAAYEWFFREKGQRPKGPDSLYSPFNPLHPLYKLLYDLSKPELPPT
jgi:hypothetical protein